MTKLKKENQQRDFKTNVPVEIIKHLDVLREGSNGWNQELNLVSWYGKEPVYDIRWWSESGAVGRGITLQQEEMKRLLELAEHNDI